MPFEHFGIDFDKHKAEIIELLANQIIVKEHKLNYIKERRLRRAQTTKVFLTSSYNDISVGGFVEMYQAIINSSVAQSHLWQAPAIEGALSFQESHENEQQGEVSGIAALRENRPENNCWINKIMEKIHA